MERFVYICKESFEIPPLGFLSENKETAIKEINEIFLEWRIEIEEDSKKEYDETFLFNFETFKGISLFDFEILTMEEYHERLIRKKDENSDWGES